MSETADKSRSDMQINDANAAKPDLHSVDTPPKKRNARKTVIIFSLRLMAAYILVSTVVFFGGYRAVETAMPAIKTVISAYGSEHELTDISIGGDVGHVEISFTMQITKHFPGVSIPLVESLSKRMAASILFVPHIIFYSLLLSWPGLTWRRRLIAGLLSIPAMSAFFVLDAAMTVVSLVEVTARNYLRGYAVDHAFLSNLLIYLSHFFNNGGRQFMGVATFLALVMPVQLAGKVRLKKPKRIKKPAGGRRALCPCGSGKKYKNCCGKGN